jgi:hypothetical protein
VSCVTLMANRSDRRFQTLSPRMAARGRETDQPNEARGNPSRPGLHLTPDKQAGYMTATEFQIASAIQPLTRAGSIYAWRRKGDLNLRDPSISRSFYGLRAISILWGALPSARTSKKFFSESVRRFSMTARPYLAMRSASLAYKRTTSAVRAARGCDDFPSRKQLRWPVRQSSSAGWLPMPNEHAKPPPLD